MNRPIRAEGAPVPGVLKEAGRDMVTQRNPLRRFKMETAAADARSDTLQGLRNGALGALLALVPIPNGVTQGTAAVLLAESGVQLTRGGLEAVVAIYQHLSNTNN